MVIPVVPASTGIKVSSVVFEGLVNWDFLNRERTFGFGTTVSYIGKYKGACNLLQQQLGRKIMFLACRHHIFELVLHSVFKESQFVVISGPDIQIFKKFKEIWSEIEIDKYSCWNEDDFVVNVLNSSVDEILQYAKQKIIQKHPRDDYLEFLELIIIFLGGVPPHGNLFRQPGAYHLARYMGEEIYCLKIYLFKKQFTISKKKTSKR